MAGCPPQRKSLENGVEVLTYYRGELTEALWTRHAS